MTEKVDNEGQDDGYKRSDERLTFCKAATHSVIFSTVVVLIAIGHSIYHIISAMWLAHETEPTSLAAFGLAAIT